MPLTTAQSNELAKPVTRTAYFVEMQFASSTLRVSTLNQTVTVLGYDWAGVGSLGSIDAVEESDSLTPTAVNFTLNIAQPSILALAVGDVEAYRGRVAKMYMCPLNESFQLVDTPVVCWTGIMDMMSVGIQGEQGQITLKCETSAYGLKRRPTLRMNAAQQKKVYPTDTGFDYLTDLIAQPQSWLSRRFQAV